MAGLYGPDGPTGSAGRYVPFSGDSDSYNTGPTWQADPNAPVGSTYIDPNIWQNNQETAAIGGTKGNVSDDVGAQLGAYITGVQGGSVTRDPTTGGFYYTDPTGNNFANATPGKLTQITDNSGIGALARGVFTDTGGIGPLLLGAGLGVAGSLGSIGAGTGELASGAATGAGSLPEWAGGAVGNGAAATAANVGAGFGDIASGGLTSLAGVGSGFAGGAGDFASAGIDAGSANPFSFSGADPMANLPSSPFTSPVTDPSWGVNPQNNSFNTNQMPSWSQPSSASTPTTVGDSTPSWAQQAVSDGGMQANNPFASLAQKYGPDVAKSLLNYLMNQSNAKQAQQAGQTVNPLLQAQRAPFINQATQNVTDPNAFLSNPQAQAMLAQINAQTEANYGKHGFNGGDAITGSTAMASTMAGLLTAEQNSLLPYTGFDQNTSTTQYLAQRDSLAFKTQSFQGITALAAKIGADSTATKAIGDGAVQLGQSIMSFFS